MPMEPYPYRQLSMHPLGRYRIELGELACEDGPSPYSIVHMRPFATVAAFVDGRMAFVRQYRYSVGSWQLELPAGGMEPGEDPRDAAVRELREETGLVAHDLIDLGMVYPSVGSTDERCYVYAARCDGRRVACEPDPGEQTELVCLSREDVERMMDAGEMPNVQVYVAWAMLQRHGLLDELFPCTGA